MLRAPVDAAVFDAAVLIRVNCIGRQRAADLAPLLPALCDVVEDSATDPTTIGVTLDWVQYRHNFRPPVSARRFVDADEAERGVELAIDVRRIGDCDLPAALHRALEPEPGDSRVLLEDFVPPSQSITWAFNRCYWEHLSAWGAVFDQDYASALPGGVSDGTNPEFWTTRIKAFIAVLDELSDGGLLPPEIYVMELGVGSGAQARVWLDTFHEQCLVSGRTYYERLQYLMTDYSRDVLQTAREAVESHRDRVSLLNLDATDPLESLAFLRYKVLFIHSCNLYDNLPTDEMLERDGAFYAVWVRAYLEREDAERIGVAHDVDVDALPATIDRLLRVGPDAIGDEVDGVRFWADVWEAVRLDEQYRPISDAEGVLLAPSTSLRLSDVARSWADGTRGHLSTVALRSFVNTLALLHPAGIFQVQDIFVRDPAQYGTFRGPGKMEGSVVNWLNGPLFQQVAEQLGFHVALEPFAFREKSNTIVLTTSPKD